MVGKTLIAACIPLVFVILMSLAEDESNTSGGPVEGRLSGRLASRGLPWLRVRVVRKFAVEVDLSPPCRRFSFEPSSLESVSSVSVKDLVLQLQGNLCICCPCLCRPFRRALRPNHDCVFAKDVSLTNCFQDLPMYSFITTWAEAGLVWGPFHPFMPLAAMLPLHTALFA